LRIREEELSDEAMPMARYNICDLFRRKCYEPVMEFVECRQDEGFFWYVFNCQEDFNDVAICFEHEYNVEMDKKRRDMKRNPEGWWRQYYDENGEVGKQA
jgi:hypothetical protein